jgi:rhamnulose-1-phosphate aldolase/alcohol dehydrogenase
MELVSVASAVAHRVESLWPPDAEVPAETLDQLVLASRLLGANRAVANFGGGNTSAKGLSVDHAGRQGRTLWVKGSGSDLATIDLRHFTALRLDEVEPLIERAEMSDEEMVAYLGRCMLDPAMPRSSIETLLHAFIPAAHVHHTHPDGINAIAGAEEGEQILAEIFGPRAAWIPYIRPGFTLAKQVGEIVRSDGNLELVVLAKHGLVVWGDTAEQAYRRTVAVINEAVEEVNRRNAGAGRFGAPAAEAVEVTESLRRQLLAELLPVARGAVSSERHKVLAVDTSEPVLELVASAAGERLSQVGAACPDHLVHTKRLPLWIPFDPGRDDATTLGERIRERAAAYREDYRAFLEAHGGDADAAADPDPRIVLVQHLGMVAAGTSVKASRLSRDLYLRAIEVMAGAEALGGFTSLTAAESFAVEYWPLELYKLSLAPQPGELQGQVALVTGAAGGIGRAVAAALAAAGACVVAFDLDGDWAANAVGDLGERGLGVGGDVTREEDVAEAFTAATEAFGGVDVVVSNAGIASSAPITETTLADWEQNHRVLATGYFLVSRATFELLDRQRLGGSIVFVASKNAVAAGRNTAAYSSAKAAELHLARCLAEEGGAAGIRVNTVNPDAVLQGSRIWSSGWRRERAAAYGIAPEELEDYYRGRTTLGVNVYPADVANAVLHFASVARSGKTTGNMLNVDGGVAAAYPR